MPACRIMLGQWGYLWESGHGHTTILSSSLQSDWLTLPMKSHLRLPVFCKSFFFLFPFLLTVSFACLHVAYNYSTDLQLLLGPCSSLNISSNYKKKFRDKCRYRVLSFCLSVNSPSCPLVKQYFCGKTIL